MWYHIRRDDGSADSSVVTRLRGLNPNMEFVVRLWDSYWEWENPPRIPAAAEYAQAQARLAETALQLGITMGQWDNEPQYTWWKTIPNEDDRKRQRIREWRQFTREAVTEFKRIRPAGFRIGFTPFAATWINSWLDITHDLAPLFDFVCVNEYWQLSRFMLHPDLGSMHVGYHIRYPDKPLVISEYANSLFQRETPPSLPSIARSMTRQYPVFLQEASKKSYIDAAFAFILPGSGPGTEDWRGFWITEPTALALGQAWVDAQNDIHLDITNLDQLDDGDKGLDDPTDFPIVSPTTISRSNFAAVLQNANSPVAGLADQFYDTCLGFGVNPAVALAFFNCESSLATDPNGLAGHTLNWGNLTRPTNPSRTTGQTFRFFYKDDQGVTHFHDFPIYRSWVDGLADFCDRLTDPAEVYVRQNLRTVSQVIPVFAPASDANKPAKYIEKVVNLVNKWSDLRALQRDVTAESPVIGPASGTVESVIAYVSSRLPAASEYKANVAEIAGHYFNLAPAVGIDPFLAAAQWVLETDGLKATWAARGAGRAVAPHRSGAWCKI